MTYKNSERGNALFIVLIGIGLFVALMFTLSRNNKINNGDAERAAIYAQRITSYADKVANAVQTVMLQGGCMPSQINFDNPTVAGYSNGSDARCKIFDVGGAGLTYQPPPPEAIDTAAATAASSTLANSYVFSGNICVTNQGTGPAASACSSTNADLVLVVPFVTQTVCAQINQLVANSTTIPTVAASTFNGTKYTGSFAGTYTIATSGTTRASGCFQSSNSPPGTGYHYYATLYAQ